MVTWDRQLHPDCPPSLTSYGLQGPCGQVLLTLPTYFLPLSFSALLSSYAGRLLLSRWHTFLPDGPPSVASWMPLPHPFQLAASPPSGCNFNMTSREEILPTSLPKVVPLPLFSTSAPISYIVLFPVLMTLSVCLLVFCLPFWTLLHPTKLKTIDYVSVLFSIVSPEPSIVSATYLLTFSFSAIKLFPHAEIPCRSVVYSFIYSLHR